MGSTEPPAASILECLAARGERLVLAESCTGGAVAAAFAAVAGASRVLEGSFVTYSADAKRDWLGVAAQFLRRHGTVASATSSAMAEAALARCPVAEWALAVTGHLGPGADPELDGQVFVAIAKRSDAPRVVTRSGRLTTQTRGERHREATEHCLSTLAGAIGTGPASRGAGEGDPGGETPGSVP